MTAHKPPSPVVPRPVVLCILDGWGYMPEGKSNSIKMAATPNWNRLMTECPTGLIEASARDVGLPEGQMGNSEFGHMNLGAGRVVMQDLVRIDAAIEDRTLAKNPTLKNFIDAMKKSGGTAHVLGLMSPGGVHSHQKQLAALAVDVARAGVKVKVHAFLDGRDTPPKSATEYLEQFQKDIGSQKGVEIATVIGRYYAMDRDNRWDRVSQAYDLLVDGKGSAADSAKAAVEASYAAGKTDEFLLPVTLGGYKGMADGDGILMANFRADRAREILNALLDDNFKGFERSRTVRFAKALGLVEYSTELNKLVDTVFAPEDLHDTFGEYVASKGLRQLRIAETEKYAHVTFFFNGGREQPFEGEERILVPSPKVATYDLQPEMSAPEVTEKLVAAIGSGRFDTVIVNFANTDMVGHSGMIPAAVKAVEAVDTALGKLMAAVKQAGGCLLVTADHGNIELMVDPETGEPHTAHTTNPVPAVLFNGPASVTSLAHGKLADVAPTLLALLGLEQPAAMKGHSLLVTREAARPRDQRILGQRASA
ncbi:MAG TPA: 2,3-bisphosphoglycerate-independent phosphoglycerate mutase [Stellaceae bacterium]|nr:2,3-bisphosphoglycerate-independent phosphoglycerate mutase [Stellaceae bacterium]